MVEKINLLTKNFIAMKKIFTLAVFVSFVIVSRYVDISTLPLSSDETRRQSALRLRLLQSAAASAQVSVRRLRSAAVSVQVSARRQRSAVVSALRLLQRLQLRSALVASAQQRRHQQRLLLSN